MSEKKGIKVISGSGNPILSEDIVQLLKTQYIQEDPQVEVISNKFADGETNVQISDNVRGYDVFVIQSLSHPINDNLVELLFILDALKRSDVKSITVIVPYYGYARQDKKIQGREPISASVVARMIQLFSPIRLITIDLHSPQIQGFFNICVDNLYASKEFMKHLNNLDNLCIVAPDKGATERAHFYSEKLNVPMAICYKHRDNPNEISEMDILGNVKNKNCVLVDDIADTCGTLIKAANILKEQGANTIRACVTHPVFSGNGIEKLEESEIDEINITDTVSLCDQVRKCNKFNIISVAPLLGEVISQLYFERSISEIFL